MTALIIGMLVEYRRVFRYPNVMPPIDFSSIPPLAYVFFSLSLLATAVELVFAFIENEIGRKITKCFCVGFLAVMTIVWLPDAWLIYCGAIFGTIGDFLLLKKHKVYPMVFGTLAFLIGHAFYIACYASLVHMEWWLFLGLGVFFVLFCVVGYNRLHKIIKEGHMAFGATLYFGTLVLDFLFAVSSCFLGGFDYLFLAALGGVCFIVSDCFLVRTSFVRDMKRRDFFIMSTYVLAQILIILGCCFTYQARI